MKTPLLKVFLISCVLFLGIKNAEAAKTLTVSQVSYITNLASDPLNKDQTKIALLGFSINNNGSTNSIATVTAFQISGNGNNYQTYFPGGISIYSSASPTFSLTGATPASLVQTFTSPSSTANLTLTLSGANQFTINHNATSLYYFIVVDFTDQATTTAGDDFQFSLTNVTASGFGISGVTAAGHDYNIVAPVTLNNPTFSNVAVNPLSTSASNLAILGFSVATTQTEIFTKFILASSSAIGTYFTGTPTLYVNSTASSSGATVVPATFSVAGNVITVTLTTAQTLTGATTKYYYIQYPTYTVPSTSATFELDLSSASTATYTYTNGAPATGTLYNLGPLSYDWNPTTTSGGYYQWTTAANWLLNGSTATTYPGQSGSSDIVRIGSSVSYSTSRQPTLNTTSLTVGSITFGSITQTYIGGFGGGYYDYNNVILTVNAATLTSGTITNSYPNATNGYYAFFETQLEGTGTITCTGSFNVGVTTYTPPSNSVIASYVESDITQLNLNGNLNLVATGNGSGSNSIAYPYFDLNQNKVTLLGQFVYSATNSPTYGLASGLDGDFLADGRFTMDDNGYACTLELQNANPIAAPTTNFNVDFDNYGYNSTVLYDDPVATDVQAVYTSNTNGLGVAPTNYIYIKFAGPSTKQAVGGAMTINNDWTSANSGTGGAVDLSTNSPTITVGGNWYNSVNVTQGAASITVSSQLAPSAGTITGGSGFLTAGSMLFSGGNLTAGSGTVTCNGTYVNNGGLFNCGTAASASVYFKSTYTNNSGTFTANPTSTSSVYFTGTNQTIQDNTTAGTTLNNVTFSGNNTAISVSTGAAGTGNFAIANTGTLTMGSSAKLTAGSGSAGGAGYLTLLSTASSTASVAQIPTTSSIVGAVNVQRSITGGTGTRGYRLLSSPVNISTNAAGAGNLSLAYLNTNATFGGVTYPGALTMGPGTGFTINGSTNPIIYLYDETRTTNNTGFTTGKNIGIYSVLSTTVTTLTGTTQGATAIPVGNSYLLYYVGNNTSTVVANTRVPDNTVITATGYINQGGTTGTIPVKFWKLGTTPIPYDVNGGNLPGLNQVGNPFPCTISLNTVSTDNTAISKVFWELIPGGSYVSYSAATGHPVSDARASNYIVSGQGFLIQAQAASETLTFKEGEKVSPYPTGLATPFNTATSTALLMSLPTKPGSNTDLTAQSISTSPIIASEMTAPPATDSAMQTYLATRPSPSLIGLHLQITKDSLNYIQTGIYFNKSITNDNYSQNNDAVNVNGSGAQVFLASYSADNVSLGINQLSDYTKGKRIKLYTAVASTGLYTISLADIANIDTGMYNVYLVDKKMNDSLDMVRYKSYAFNIDNGDTTTYGANRFVLAIERKALPPYQLIEFAGEKVSTGVQLNWQTLNESDYTGFALQKLTNTDNYSILYTLQSNGGSNYSYIDKHPITGNNTYRLQQTDMNGNITYSSAVTINYDSKSPNGSMTVYPNPSRSIITISIALNTTTSDYVADIYNTSGTIISHQVVKANTWTQDISSYKLGVYIIEVKTNSGDLVGKSKFVKIN